MPGIAVLNTFELVPVPGELAGRERKVIQDDGGRCTVLKSTWPGGQIDFGDGHGESGLNRLDALRFPLNSKDQRAPVL